MLDASGSALLIVTRHYSCCLDCLSEAILNVSMDVLVSCHEVDPKAVHSAASRPATPRLQKGLKSKWIRQTDTEVSRNREKYVTTKIPYMPIVCLVEERTVVLGFKGLILAVESQMEILMCSACLVPLVE